MQVATVIPIARGIPFDTLTYYSADTLQNGTLVEIPFGKQTINGIVVDCIPLTEAKTLVKSAAFSLKKIKRIVAHIPYFERAISALRTTAAQSFAPIGAVAGAVIPSILFDHIAGEKISVEQNSNTTFIEHCTVATIADRANTYKQLIRTAFAEKKSVVFVTPTIRGLAEWKGQLEKGIQKHVIILHSKVSKKDMRSYFSLIKSSERPLLIFATPGYLLIPRADVGYMIAEDESSTLYKTSDRYMIDLRIVVRDLAEALAIDLTWGDTMPRFETLARLNADHLPRSYVPEKLHIVPVEHYRNTLPTEVMDLVFHAQKKKRRLFIYTNRKGVAPLSRCGDCATIVTCPACTLPMVLRNRTRAGITERYFSCTHCGEELGADHHCTYCGSWNIVPRTIGTESVRDEIVSAVGADNVFTIDDDLVPDSSAIEKLITEVQQKKFAVVIGTIKVLPYLQGIHYTIIPYLDRILSTPSLYTTESVLRLVMDCDMRSSDGVILCTRTPDFPLIKQLETKKLNAIITDELMVRKELKYPPYGVIIKISLTTPEGYRTRIKESVERYFSSTDITALPARRVSLGSMKVLMVWIMTATPTYIEEENQQIISFLDSLHMPYKVEQNPERF